MSLHFVEDDNLSMAWARAVAPMLRPRGTSEVIPLVVTVTGFDNSVAREEVRIRSSLDAALRTLKLQSIDTVANTIFPQSLWNPASPRSVLFERYAAVLPRLKKFGANRRGLYFERLTTGGRDGNENQLDFVIRSFTARRGMRRSVLQTAVFDPRRDHSPAALLGFPCLQHVSFAPADHGLAINAFYATQFAFERAYGNYLGICRLGRFVAHELGMPLVRMTCFTGIMQRDVSVGRLASLKTMIQKTLAGRDQTR